MLFKSNERNSYVTTRTPLYSWNIAGILRYGGKRNTISQSRFKANIVLEARVFYDCKTITLQLLGCRIL